MGKFTDYKINLAQLSEGSHEFEWKLGDKFFSDMENADIHGADLTARLELEYRHGSYTLHFAINGEVTLLCDRCLDALPWPIDCTYDIEVRYGDDYDDSSDTVLVLPHSDTSLNVAYMLHETVALSVPMRHVHPTGKCNRAMSQTLKRHRAPGSDPDEELEQGLIDEMDSMDTTPDADNEA